MKNKYEFLRLVAVILLASMAAGVSATYPVDLDVMVAGGSGSGTFAPYYVASNNHGILTQSSDVLVGAGLYRRHSEGTSFSYAWGGQLIGGLSSSTTYSLYDGERWVGNPQYPSRVWLQQLWGEMRYRSLFLEAGLKNQESALFNNSLSSGDVIQSPNARPVPQVRAGFNDFQPIPFTNGWVEIQGELSYGVMTDGGWLKDHFNYYTGHYNDGEYYSYKRCYLRTKSSKPLSLTLGMQVSSFFGGTTYYYEKGEFTKTEKHKAGIKEFFKILIPREGDESYYLGSSLGSWDVVLRYNMPWGGTIKGYFQKLWETGSGIGFLNGFDGLWGIEYNTGFAPIDGVVIEYLDFTNQSGPIHFDPADIDANDFPYHTDGEDDYYNNCFYNAYANYGMSMGTPFLPSPIYNRDGFLQFTHNSVRGFHIGVSGHISKRLAYRVLGSYRKSWGTLLVPIIYPMDDTSMLVEATYTPAIMNDKLNIKAQVAFDRGKLYGNTFGAFVTVNYNTSLFSR